MKSKVTTKKGDAGTTRTLGGETVSKASPVIACTGALDALRARVALLRLKLEEAGAADAEEHAAFLWWVLHACFLMGAQVNDPEDRHPEYRKRNLGAAELEKLEAEMGRIEGALELPRSFLVSAGTVAAAEGDVTATVARDFERALVRLAEATPAFDAEILLAFANRLSDYFFLLARALEGDRRLPVDYAVLDA